ncbi:hypothetical protein CBL_08656 [Carabus blaptoides fortunei]
MVDDNVQSAEDYEKQTHALCGAQVCCFRVFYRVHTGVSMVFACTVRDLPGWANTRELTEAFDRKLPRPDVMVESTATRRATRKTAPFSNITCPLYSIIIQLVFTRYVPYPKYISLTGPCVLPVCIEIKCAKYNKVDLLCSALQPVDVAYGMLRQTVTMETASPGIASVSSIYRRLRESRVVQRFAMRGAHMYNEG